MVTARKPARITYRKGVIVGAAAAEQDNEFLSECFVDNGTVNILSDTERNESIILGRVGAGKSALISQLESTNRCVRIEPDEFSMSFIENSSAIQLLNELGVSLDVLFQALWKHVLAVEALRLKYKDSNLRESLEKLFSSKGKRDAESEAWQYFKDFGGSDFWNTVELRIREIVSRTEKSVEVETGANSSQLLAKIRAKGKVSDDEKREYHDRCQRAVSGVQIQKLHKVVDALHDVLDDKQKKYFIVIDDLDTNWASSTIRYRLIRALIEAIKKFRKIRNLKIVVAMRVDLLDTVFRETRDSGFQEEKFEAFFLRLRWGASDLIDIMDRRIRKVFKDQYTNANVGFYDIFQEKIGSQSTGDYISERIAGRPRDAILFLNFIFQEAEGKTQITKRVIQQAEVLYSASRAASLCDEWHDRYPNLNRYLRAFQGFNSRFLVSEIPLSILEDLLLDCLSFSKHDEISRLATEIAERGRGFGNHNEALTFLNKLLSGLLVVGAVGAKFEATGRPEWALNAAATTYWREFELNTQIHIHPMLYRHLGIRPVGATK